jgi:hypothetical protein
MYLATRLRDRKAELEQLATNARRTKSETDISEALGCGQVFGLWMRPLDRWP